MDVKWNANRVKLELYAVIDRRLTDIDKALSSGVVSDVTIDSPFVATNTGGVINITFDSLTLINNLLTALPGPYGSDVLAEADGVNPGEWYLTSDLHVLGYGLAKRIPPVS